MTADIAGTRQFLKGSLWSAASVLWTTLALLVVGKMATNALPAQAVGLFALVLVCADFFNMLFSGGLWITMPKLAAAASTEERPALLGSVLLWQCWVVAAGSALGLAGWILAKGGLLDWLPPSAWGVTQLLWAVVLLSGVGIFRDLLLAMLAGMDRYASRATAMAVASLVQVAAVYLAVWSFGGGVSSLVLCLVLGYGTGVAVCAGIVLRGAHLNVGMGRAREAVRFSGPLYINSLLVFLYQRTDTLLIGGLIGLEAAAVLEMVKRLPMVLTRVMGAALTPYLPSMSRHIAVPNLLMAGALAGKAARTVGFLGYCIALSAMVVREPLIRLLFAESYVGGATVLCLLLITAVPALQAGIMTQALIALGRNRMILAVNTGVIAITVLGTVILAPHWGLAGAGAAALAGNVCSLAAQTCWARRRGLPVSWGSAFLPHLAAAPFAALSCLSAGWDFRVLAVVLFVAGCAALRVIRKDDLVTVWRAACPEADTR